MDARSTAKAALRGVPPLQRLAINVAHETSRGHRWRAARRTVSYDVRTRLLKRPTVAPIGSHSEIIIYADDTNGQHAACRNPPNWPEMGVWQRWLKPGDLFIDVGANIGIYTLFALDLGAQVIACEPDGKNAARLRENLDLNGYTAEIVQKAVSNEPGILRFTQGLDSYNHIVLEGATGVEVEAVTLDEILGDRTAAGVKVDVEGAERLVLEGARKALTERRIRLLQLEWSGAEVQRTLGEGRDPLAQLLREVGYEIHRPERRSAELQPVTGSVPAGRDVFALPA